MIKLSPSVLAADFGHLEDEINKSEAAGIDFLHMDIMDGHFVPNLTFGPQLVKYVDGITDIPMDVHLMITNPMEYIEIYAEAGADVLTLHYEVLDHPRVSLEKIRALGVKSGISVSPNTPFEAVRDIMDAADWFLVMSVHPGFAGQKFIPSAIDKICEARQFIDQQQLNCEIQVDGGIDLNTAPRVAAAGANILVTGSAFYKSADYADFTHRIKEACIPQTRT